MKNSVLLVDDHILFREGLRSIARHWEDFEIVGEASSGSEAILMARDLEPDVILMDISMSDMTGIEAMKNILKERPSVKVIMLTMSEEDEDLFRAIQGGAQGYVLKDTPSKRLHDQLRGVMRGESPLSGVVATKMLAEFSRPRAGRSGGPELETESLTEREKQVIQLVAEGKSNSAIAEELCLSENTVKKNVHNILAKLQLTNRVEAALYAVNKNR